MPQFVMKVTKDQNLYVAWSTVVDDAIGFGTREEMIAELRLDAVRGEPPEISLNHAEECMARANRTGTSHHPTAGVVLGAWGDEFLQVDQRGILRRADLGDYVNAKTNREAYAFLQPFGDDNDG